MWRLQPSEGWGRRVGRWVGLGWTAWFLQEDEEALGLAQRDELSRTYVEEAQPNQTTRRESSYGTPPSSPDTQQEPRSSQTRSQTPSPRITTWEAGWNVTNAIQGIFVLGLPYALLQSGYLGLVLLPLAAVVCNYTGQILVSCLYEEDESGLPVRVRDSYEDVANASCRGLCPLYPRLGGWLVNLAQLLELVMTCTLYLVVSTNLLAHSLSSLPSALALAPGTSAALCPLVPLLVLLPCLLLADLRVVSKLSMLCSLAQLLTTLLVMLYCLGGAGGWAWETLPVLVPYDRMLVSVGVIIFSYTSQIFLPTLEGNMENRQEFCSMLGWTHGLACLLKTLFSLLAFLTWGANTREVITDNLPSPMRTMVNLCLLTKALLSYPLPFYAATELLLASIRGGGVMSKEGEGPPGLEVGSVALRGGLLLLTFLLAQLVPHFSLLMGLTGSVTGAAMSLILPCVFHLRLRWAALSGWSRMLDLIILTLGTICSLSGLLCSLHGLLQAVRDG
ncbi:vesicular inhibitory amino acid transporter [Osmerus mordax]|uniref:vesicular inhibitory amino acid transporter n=1 Tax=Osmerus mordax TaxID=8014 RepID=UPI00350EBFD0